MQNAAQKNLLGYQVPGLFAPRPRGISRSALLREGPKENIIGRFYAGDVKTSKKLI